MRVPRPESERPVLFVLAAVLALLGPTACSGSSAATDGGGGNDGGGNDVAGEGAGGADAAADGISAAGDEACGKVAAARCMQMKSCTNGIAVTRDFAGDAECVARLKLGCTTGLGDPGSSWTPAGLSTCAEAIGAQTCADYLAGKDLAACQPAPGTLGSGTPCVVNAQCASTFCLLGKGAGCGTCAPLPKAGDACEPGQGGCGPTLSCLGDPGVTTCQTPGVVDAACDKKKGCAPTLGCVIPMLASTGACKVLGATVGAACDAKHETAPGCDVRLGLVCNGKTSMCELATFTSAGMVCGLRTDGSTVGCAAGGMCNLAMGSKSGSCVAAAADGAACDTAMGPPCLTPAVCVLTTAGGTAGTCKIRGASSCP